ncbi:hypothetical protein COO91_02260 [Nostoc flagelliforme CCNUN1]|uniref:Uncharacterized protein n=1 Tax=Nostoc flagelliforme CCNUN1 TaxID=2038116 RepID=A0A2K8SLR2_9NOSO|nr:hypothetical protein COO91_02260 [Nostoc flagelliforme CCNUN1]
MWVVPILRQRQKTTLGQLLVKPQLRAYLLVRLGEISPQPSTQTKYIRL